MRWFENVQRDRCVHSGVKVGLRVWYNLKPGYVLNHFKMTFGVEADLNIVSDRKKQ